MTNQPKRLTARDLEQRLACTKQTLWRWYRDPKINLPRPHYLGQKRVWLESEIEAWEAERMSDHSSVKVG